MTLPAPKPEDQALTRSPILAAAAILTASLAMSAPHGAAAQDSRLATRGKAILAEKCSRCHAVGKADASPLKEAPPFRAVARKYPVEQLAEALAEGIVTGHPAMPEFTFAPRDVAAILAYLRTLAPARAKQ